MRFYTIRSIYTALDNLGLRRGELLQWEDNIKEQRKAFGIHGDQSGRLTGLRVQWNCRR